MDPTVSSFSATPAASTPKDPPEAGSWHIRMRRLLVIGFDELDDLDLDLGTPRELDRYVCDLFERAPCVKP